MKMIKAKKKFTTQKYWYLGFLGFIGIYKLPQVITSIAIGESLWELLSLLWLFWFSCFLPESLKKVNAEI